MRQFGKTLMFLVVFLGFASICKASTCEYTEISELNSIVANLKIAYEEAQGIKDPNIYPIPDAILGTPEEETYVGTYDYFKINITNIVEEIYLDVTNNNTNVTTRYYYNDATDGVISFDWLNLSEVTSFTVKVYASSATGCEGELYRTLYLTVPRLNEFYGFDICELAEGYYMCDKYVTFGTLTYDQFYDGINSYINKNQDSESDLSDDEGNDGFVSRVWNFIKDNGVWFITGGVVVIIAAGVITYVIVKKRRRDII